MPTLVAREGTRREKIGSDSEQDADERHHQGHARTRRKTVCFVNGEGERGHRGLRRGRLLLGEVGARQKTQYATKEVMLLREGKMPAGLHGGRWWPAPAPTSRPR